MTTSYWFGVTYTFTCPKCSQVSNERIALNSGTNDPEKINAALKRDRLSCQNCLAALSGKTPVNVNVRPGTLEELRSEGYPLPESPAQSEE